MKVRPLLPRLRGSERVQRMLTQLTGPLEELLGDPDGSLPALRLLAASLGEQLDQPHGLSTGEHDELTEQLDRLSSALMDAVCFTHFEADGDVAELCLAVSGALAEHFKLGTFLEDLELGLSITLPQLRSLPTPQVHRLAHFQYEPAQRRALRRAVSEALYDPGDPDRRRALWRLGGALRRWTT